MIFFIYLSNPKFLSLKDHTLCYLSINVKNVKQLLKTKTFLDKFFWTPLINSLSSYSTSTRQIRIWAWSPFCGIMLKLLRVLFLPMIAGIFLMLNCMLSHKKQHIWAKRQLPPKCRSPFLCCSSSSSNWFKKCKGLWLLYIMIIICIWNPFITSRLSGLSSITRGWRF